MPRDVTPSASVDVSIREPISDGIVATEATDAFTDADVTLARLPGANATVALDQVTSESRLVRQRDTLELLTRMMSHDVRTDLQVVGAAFVVELRWQ